MKKIILSLFVLSLLASCHSTKNTTSNYNLPNKIEKDPEKVGRACNTYLPPFSFLFSSTDNTVETARKNGGIKEIVSIESESGLYFIIYRSCTVVRGN